MLAGALQKASVGRCGQEEIELHRQALEKWGAFCAELGENSADIGLAWLLFSKLVTNPIIGPRTLNRVQGSLRALDITLETDTLKQIDEVFRPVGINQRESRTAPEAYAW